MANPEGRSTAYLDPSIEINHSIGRKKRATEIQRLRRFLLTGVFVDI